MDTYVARQPIFNRRKRIFGYELLFRDAAAQRFASLANDEATTTVLSNTFFTIGANRMAGGKKMFVNFTQNLLLRKAPLLLPRDAIVVEILEGVDPTPELIAACREMAQQGYTLALDDYVEKPAFQPLVALADIIKIDFRNSSLETIRSVVATLPPSSRRRLLAEKVETHDEFDIAKQMGFDLFQGFFFAKPELITGKDISGSQINLLRIVASVNQPDFDFKSLEQLIMPDVSLTYKLLRYCNSAFFAKAQSIGSVQQALVYMGEAEIRRFVSLVAMSQLAKGKPGELIRTSSIRGKFCEQLGAIATAPAAPAELFTLGIFSLIDAIIDQPMARIMEGLPLDKSIKAALAKRGGPLIGYLALIEYYEKGQWGLFERIADALHIPKEKVPELYRQACAWADAFPDWD
ncbi:EAL and HDOD domain-containing protein [Desulfatitalea alkaliphila]|uniref:HDOD domain-containing protein n=1 Tax=Desulfatitalea alkaliphila TaxID=2929485 RepID=A0AA41R3Q2_9BACT|nr:HDOD domain-containing protein [Desulfatitalea alkaliphila]MCJ8500470.1 HDOD domain-containing protein [Desulfatitalea alkaliphila]